MSDRINQIVSDVFRIPVKFFKSSVRTLVVRSGIGPFGRFEYINWALAYGVWVRKHRSEAEFHSGDRNDIQGQ